MIWPGSGTPAIWNSPRRFTCEHCRRPFAESLEAIRPHGRCTRRYEQRLFEQCRDTPILAVRRQDGLGYKMVEGLYYRLGLVKE